MSTIKLIKLTQFQHNETNQIGVYFDYNFNVKEYVKNFEGMRWTRTFSCFYIAFTKQNANNLGTYIRKGGYSVDFSDLFLKKVESKPVQLQNFHKSLLNDYKRYLVGKRYSNSNIRSYSFFVEKFLFFLKDKNPEKANNNDIRLFVENQGKPPSNYTSSF